MVDFALHIHKSAEWKVAGYKKELFHEFDENVKTVMELGIGTGPNLKYYGGRASVSKVIGVDPNMKMAPYAQAAASAVGLQPSQFQFLHAVFPLTFTLNMLHCLWFL